MKVFLRSVMRLFFAVVAWLLRAGERRPAPRPFRPVLELLDGRVLPSGTPVMPAGPALTRDGAILCFNGSPVRIETYGDYGMAAEANFNSHAFLNEIAAKGLNGTHVWLDYPWTQSLSPFQVVKGKFDLTKFNDDYFNRLADFVGYAATKNVVVTLTLFNGSELTGDWAHSPYNSANNVNHLLSNPQQFGQTSGPLWDAHAKLIKHVAEKLGRFGNLVLEPVNEPTGHSIDLNGHAFNERVTTELRSDLTPYTTGSRLIMVNVDGVSFVKGQVRGRGADLYAWAVNHADIVSVHVVTPSAAGDYSFVDNFKGIDRPLMVSQDGDVTQMSAKQAKDRKDTEADWIQGGKRDTLTRALLDEAFRGEHAFGHVHIDFLDKGLMGSTWMPGTKYVPQSSLTSKDIETVLQEFER